MFEPIDRVMKNKRGGAVPRRTQIGGQDHMLSYITPTEAEILMQLGGSGEPGPAGIPAFRGDPGQMADAQDSLGGGNGGNDGPDPDFDPLAGTQTYDAATGAPTSFDATPGTGNYGGYEDDDFGFAQPATSGGGVVGAQQSYNMANAITLDNPYGNKGFFTRVFGIPANKISYSNIMSANTRASIANNQFSKFANPTNQPGKIGYNPAFETAKPGFLRPGVQKKGFNTALGPVQEFAKQRSPMDMLAIAGIGALNPALGILTEALTDTTYGLPGLAPPNAAPPGEPQTFMGQAFQAGKQAISDAYAAARETLGALADRLTPEQAEVVANATPEQKAQIQQDFGVSPPSIAAQEALGQKAISSINDMIAQNTKSFGDPLSDMFGYSMQPSPEEVALAKSVTPAQDTVAFRPDTEAEKLAKDLGLASLVDALPDAPSLDMQSIPGFTQDALTGGQNPSIFGGDGGGGDGSDPDRPTQEVTEVDEDPYSYDPKITGGFYDYGQPPTFDGRILIPTEEVLKDRFNLVI